MTGKGRRKRSNKTTTQSRDINLNRSHNSDEALSATSQTELENADFSGLKEMVSIMFTQLKDSIFLELREIKCSINTIQKELNNQTAHISDISDNVEGKKIEVNEVKTNASEFKNNLTRYNVNLQQIATKVVDLENNMDHFCIKQRAELSQETRNNAGINKNFSNEHNNVNLADIRVTKFSGTYFVDNKGPHPKLFIQELESAIDIHQVHERLQLAS